MFPDDPPRHLIDVCADRGTADTVRLYERRAAAHERVCNAPLGKLVRPEILGRELARRELRQQQAAG